MTTLRDAVIVATRRSAVARAIKGQLRNTRPDDLAAQVIRGALAGLPGLPLELIAPDQRRMLDTLRDQGLLDYDEAFVRLTRTGKPLVDPIAVALMG